MATISSVLAPLGLGRSALHEPSPSSTSTSLPLYSPVATSEPSSTSISAGAAMSDTSLDSDDCDARRPQHEAQRRVKHRPASSLTRPTFALPTLARFLADFTLGFADGLTVPFALTAGLSSLGQTDTVIYAGMAEICAGSISMGIGGYLSAKSENGAAEARRQVEEDAVDQPIAVTPANRDPEKVVGMDVAPNAVKETAGSTALSRYLAPLELPPQLLKQVVSHVHRQPGIEEALALSLKAERGEGSTGGSSQGEDDNGRGCSPIMVGLSVAVGYLLGGLLPLFPYFFVGRVGDGLFWSFGVCVVALFSFGFSKDFFVGRRERRLQQEEQENERWTVSARRRSARGMPWREIRRSAWEGGQMVILGSVAALAAVLCVRAFEGMSVTSKP